MNGARGAPNWTGYRVHSAKSLYDLRKAQLATPPDGFALIDLMPSRRARVMSPLILMV
jgi:hypothetical protein